MYSHLTLRSAFRIALALLICAALLPVPYNSLLRSVIGQGRSASRTPPPRPGKPEGTFPDLDTVKSESQLEREALPPIPSTMRASKNSGKPWDGRRVGDPFPSQKLDQDPERGQTRRAHARRRASAPSPVLDDQFVQNFFNWVVVRTPSSAETIYWNDHLRVAYGQGQESLKLASIEFGRTLFESAEYAARNRDAHGYVYDLYKTYLMRDPDSGGWTYWEAIVPTHGREYVRRGFEESTEFAYLLSSMTPNGSATGNAASLISARVEPHNQPGNGMLTRDASWSVSLLSLPGRSGLDLGLGLSYSSMVWTRAANSAPYIYFDEDNGFPSPGFRLGFPTIQRKVFDAQTARNAYLLITASGRRVELRQVGTSNIYDATDSSYLRLTDNGGTLLVNSTDGTRLSFSEINGEYRCVEVKDRNGNYITVNNNALGRINTITDTLGRVITFNYDGNDNLISITQAWNGQPSHQWVSFGWATRPLQHGFTAAAVVGTPDNTTLPVITQVALNDGSHFTFDYTNALQVSVIKNYFGTIERNATSFIYDTPAGEVPRLVSSSVSARNWTGINGVPAQVTTQYSVATDGACVMTAPDGTVYREYYGTGWQRGLTTRSEVWLGTQLVKWTTVTWTQDNTSVGYEMNPRVTETNIYDMSGNRRRTVIDYGPYAQYGLPYGVREFAADGVTEIRQTYTDYNLNPAYVERRIIGLVSHVHMSNVAQWQSKITYDYDDPARLQVVPAAATQHDASYNTSFTARGNVTAVSRWDVSDINNTAKKLTTYTNYYNTGTPISTTDPAGHQSSVTYADSFSDGVNNRNTFAYPTTVTDADSFSSSVQYNFDFGATTRTQSPAPAGQTQGAIQTMSYNNLGQLERITTTNNSAYRRFWYGPNYTASYATVNNVADELYSIEVVDGAGRVIGAAGNHPGSTGGYRLVVTVYDQMGRAWKVTNPTEVNNFWVPTGDDAAGMYSTQQTYDWKGRPLVTTNQDGTTKTAEYNGCGCAGGEVVTVTDEGTIVSGATKKRQQKIYSDVLGRTWKTEVLNWDGAGPNGTGGTVYSSTITNYNVRDQVDRVRQFQGAGPSNPSDLSCPSGSCQQTLMTFDGYGRLATRHVPEQQVDTNNPASTDHTTWEYNSDDTIHKLTDARGVVSTLTYNMRHLVTAIAYTLQPGVPTTGASAVPGTSSVSFTYDAVGNRISMADGSGTKTYQYNSLSRVTSESQQFTGALSGTTYTLSYDYSLDGTLKSITDPEGAVFNYGYDSSGRLSAITGSAFGGVSTYASNRQYRAAGNLKHQNYGNGKSLDISYNSRLQPTNFAVPGVLLKDYQYHPDGRVKYSADLSDNRFDRSYEYDHGGRVTIALSGPAARGLPDTTNRPYKQSYFYDALNHLLERFGGLWTGPGGAMDSGSGEYENNRNTGWQYDAEGRITASSSEHSTYDAAARTVSNVTDESNRTITRTFDGDGIETKRIDVDTEEGTITTYSIYSSVLGEMITELNASGQKSRTFIYSNGQVLGWQLKVGTTQGVVWEFRDISNASYRETNSSGSLIRQRELDPFGNNTATNPYVVLNPVPGEDRTYPGFADLLSGSCQINGIPAPCDRVSFLLRSGAATEQPLGVICLGKGCEEEKKESKKNTLNHHMDGPNDIPDIGEFTVNVDGPTGGEYAGSYVTTTGVILGVEHLILRQTQNPIDEAGIKKTVLAALETEPCVNFAKAILGAQKRQGLGTLSDVAKSFFALSGPRFSRNRPQGSTLGVSNPIGRIALGSAQIYSLGNDSNLSANEQMLTDADNAISELFHLAAQGEYYSDEELATAVSKSSYAADAYSLMSNSKPLIDPRSNIFDPRYIPDKKDTNDRAHSFSRYFHAIQQKYCTSKPGFERGVGFQP